MKEYLQIDENHKIIVKSKVEKLKERKENQSETRMVKIGEYWDSKWRTLLSARWATSKQASASAIKYKLIIPVLSGYK